MRADRSVGAIGSCRVKTPLRAHAPAAGLVFEDLGSYGYTHTGAEALQQLRFIQDDLHIPDDIWRLIASPDLPSNFRDRARRQADIYVVEISSAKNIMCGGFALQFNYLVRHFKALLADPAVAREFWSHQPGGSDALRIQWLRSLPQFRLLSPADQALIAATYKAPSTRESVDADVRALVDRLGRERLVLVTHVNARDGTGAQLRQRKRLNRHVRQAAKAHGVRCLDPTSAMERFGQARALCDQGRDLNHYTPEFEHLVFEEIRTACGRTPPPMR